MVFFDPSWRRSLCPDSFIDLRLKYSEGVDKTFIAHYLSISLSPSLSLSLTPFSLVDWLLTALAHALSLSLSLSLIFSFLSYRLTLKLPQAAAPAHSLSLSLSFTLWIELLHFYCLTNYQIETLDLSNKLTHTPTHTHSLSLSLSSFSQLSSSARLPTDQTHSNP